MTVIDGDVDLVAGATATGSRIGRDAGYGEIVNVMGWLGGDVGLIYRFR